MGKERDSDRYNDHEGHQPSLGRRGPYDCSAHFDGPRREYAVRVATPSVGRQLRSGGVPLDRNLKTALDVADRNQAGKELAFPDPEARLFER